MYLAFLSLLPSFSVSLFSLLSVFSVVHG